MSIRRALGVSAAAAGLVLGSLVIAIPAHADVWSKNVSCGPNNNCQITSTTTGATSYNVDSVLRAYWASGGAHSWNGYVGGGSHYVTVSATTISAHNAYCFCPGGANCGI